MVKRKQIVKSTVAVILAFVMAFGMMAVSVGAAEQTQAAADQTAVESVITQIKDLPDVINIDMEELVKEARQAYDLLTDEQKATINDTVLEILQKAEEELKEIKIDKAAADKVAEKIKALPPKIDAKCKELAAAAVAAYEKLSEGQKDFLSEDTMKILRNAKAFLEGINVTDATKAAVDKVVAQIKALPSKVDKYNESIKATILAAREAYNSLTAEQKQFVPSKVVAHLEKLETAIKNLKLDQEDQAAIEKVMALIEALPAQIEALPAQIALGYQMAVAIARNAYDHLTDKQKANFSADAEKLLVKAEDAIDKAATDYVKELIKEIPSIITIDKAEVIEAAQAAYDSLNDEQKAFIELVLRTKLEDSVSELNELKGGLINDQLLQDIIDLVNQLKATSVRDYAKIIMDKIDTLVSLDRDFINKNVVAQRVIAAAKQYIEKFLHPEPEPTPQPVEKKANPITVKPTSKTFAQKKLTKAASFTIQVSKAKGTVTYTLNKAAKNAKIKVTSKGKVVVPKKCKKGTKYKVIVKAAGNSKYKAGKKVLKQSFRLSEAHPARSN